MPSVEQRANRPERRHYSSGSDGSSEMAQSKRSTLKALVLRFRRQIRSPRPFTPPTMDAKRKDSCLSVSSSVERGFHTDCNAQYVLPNDSPEHARLEAQSRYLAVAMHNKLLHAPVAHAKRILDIGCGTGIVTHQLGAQFPDADVFGLDLSPVPAQWRAAPNVHFLQGNVLTQEPSAWTAQDPVSGKVAAATMTASDRIPGDKPECFDLLFHRLLVAGMSEWQRYARIQFDLLRPGGWVEAHELNPGIYDRRGRMFCDDFAWFRGIRNAWDAVGLDLEAGEHVQRVLRDAGFVDVHVTEYVLPTSVEPDMPLDMQDFARFWHRNANEAFELMLARIVRQAGGSKEELQRLREQVQRDHSGLNGSGTSARFFVTVGRKPAA